MNNHPNRQPLVSVIVLTYNQEQTVGQTIDSILAQEINFDLEIVIGEDASPSDNTRELCEQYAAKYPHIIRLMPKAPNKGLVRNFIDCLRSCRGKYIAGCAGDDYWCENDKLQQQVDFLEANPKYVLVHTDMKHLDMRSKKIAPIKFRQDIPSGDVRLALFRESFVRAPTACYRRDAISDELLEDFSQQQFKVEDLPLWFILAERGEFSHSYNQTVTYRIYDTSISNGNTTEQRLAFHNSILDVRRHYYDKFQPPISWAEIQDVHDRYTIRILITSHDWGTAWGAVTRFGFFRVFQVFCGVAVEKLFRIKS